MVKGGCRPGAGASVCRTLARALLLLPLICGLIREQVATGQEGCRLPSDEQVEAGGALEGVLLVLHELTLETVPLEHGVAFGDPGPCPGGSLDAFRGIDILSWVLEVSGPANPTLCSPNDPPTFELPLRQTRCVDPSTTVASRSARVAFGELITRRPFPLLLPSRLPDGLEPHWTTVRVTDRRGDVRREYGTIIRYRGVAEAPWLVLLLDASDGGAWWLESLRGSSNSIPVRGTSGTLLETLPDYDGPGVGLFWEEGDLRLILFGTYSPGELAAIAATMAP
jgi:hypothetical protein